MWKRNCCFVFKMTLHKCNERCHVVVNFSNKHFFCNFKEFIWWERKFIIRFYVSELKLNFWCTNRTVETGITYQTWETNQMRVRFFLIPQKNVTRMNWTLFHVAVSTLSPEELDNILIKCDSGMEVALKRAKAWSKYAKDIISYVEKRAALGKNPNIFAPFIVLCLNLFSILSLQIKEHFQSNVHLVSLVTSAVSVCWEGLVTMSTHF